MSRITVIVPVYKVERYLHRCVDSILSQSFQDFDLVLVDDGSPDNCPAICDSYAESDKRITVIHKENGGLSDARNAGIDWAMEHSDSEWLAFVDSDDYLHPDYLLTLYNTALKESADLVICNFTRVNDKDEVVETSSGFFDLSSSEKGVLFQCLADNWRIVPAWNKLYLKTIFKDLRFALRKIHEDEFAIHHVLWNCRKAVMLSRELYYYRWRQNSIMASESNASRLDGLEAAILQYEFCLEHALPPRYGTVNFEYLNSTMDLKAGLSKQESTRYYALKKRYTKVYFSRDKNRTIKGIALFYFNTLCRSARAVIKSHAEKGKLMHE